MAKKVGEQVVVVTGASSGIGRVTARLLAQRGASVVATARSEPDLVTLVQEITSAGGTAVHAVADVRDAEAMVRVARTAVERFGRIDTWVGGAAIGVFGRAWDITPDEYDDAMRVTWLGQVHGALAALPYLRQTKGTLVCIGSVESVRAVPLQAPYVAAKFALRGFCDTLRMDLDADGAGVAVTVVLPAAIDTPFFAHARSHLDGAPKPPPPVYQPEAVAEAIIGAAEHPRRQVVVGGAGIGFLAGQGLAPGLTDRLMTAGRSMLRLQQEDHPRTAPDSLDEPVPGTDQERGGHGGRPSFTTAFTTARPLVKRAVGLGAAAAGVVAGRVISRPDNEPSTPEPGPDEGGSENGTRPA